MLFCGSVWIGNLACSSRSTSVCLDSGVLFGVLRAPRTQLCSSSVRLSYLVVDHHSVVFMLQVVAVECVHLFAGESCPEVYGGSYCFSPPKWYSVLQSQGGRGALHL